MPGRCGGRAFFVSSCAIEESDAAREKQNDRMSMNRWRLKLLYFCAAGIGTPKMIDLNVKTEES